MTQLQVAMCLLLETFQKYASTDKNPDSLSKAEVKMLLEKEMPEMISAAKDKSGVDDLIKALDSDGDGEVDFEEFMTVVAALTICFRGMHKPAKKK